MDSSGDASKTSSVMFSSRSFVLLGFPLRSMIYFKLVFVDGASCGPRSVFLRVDVTLSFPHGVPSRPRHNQLTTSSGPSAASHGSASPSFRKSHTGSRRSRGSVLEGFLQLGPRLFKIVTSGLHLWPFHENVRIGSFISTKLPAGTVAGTGQDVQVGGERNDTRWRRL